jgi:hypothetical protein
VGKVTDFGESKYVSGDLANISRSSGSTSRIDEQRSTGIWGLWSKVIGLSPTIVGVASIVDPWSEHPSEWVEEESEEVCERARGRVTSAMGAHSSLLPLSRLTVMFDFVEALELNLSVEIRPNDWIVEVVELVLELPVERGRRVEERRVVDEERFELLVEANVGLDSEK